MPLDRGWALAELRTYIELVGTYARGGSRDEVAQHAHVVEQILDRVLPRWPKDDLGAAPSQRAKWNLLREWASRAVAALQREEELREKLGDGGPQMSVGGLHPWVWDAARQLWGDGHYRAAVHAAATSVISQTQGKSGRLDVADKALFQEVLASSGATAGRPRIRVVPDDGSQTCRSIQEGAMHMGIGLSQAVRNVAAHTSEELDEQIAVEQLAAFSLWPAGSIRRQS